MNARLENITAKELQDIDSERLYMVKKINESVEMTGGPEEFLYNVSIAIAKTNMKLSRRDSLSGRMKRLFNRLVSVITMKKMTEEEKYSEEQKKISDACDSLKKFLIAKNRNYGNSALNPVKVFSKSNPGDGITIRMDDKLSRIANSDKPRKNDYVDLAGYIIIFMVQNNWTDLSEMID